MNIFEILIATASLSVGRISKPVWMPSNAPAPFPLHRWLTLVKIMIIFNHSALLLYFTKFTVTFVISSEVFSSAE